MSLTQGENLAPRTKALQDSVIPNTLNKTMQYGSMALNATNGFNGVLGSIGTNVARAGAKRAGEAAAQILPDALPGATGSTTGSAIGGGASGAGGAAGSLAGTASGVLGILGGAYGMYDAIDQFTRRGDTLSAGEISRTAPTMTMTTAGGNKYTQKGGIDSGAVLGYERANKTAKSANFAATTIGAGMATGAGIGMLAGSAVPGIGTAIGAGVGALIGGAGSLFGWFDNEDKVNDMVKTAGEINTAQNIQNKSLAYSKDLRQAFNGRIGAAGGKMPSGGPQITTIDNADAKVSKGERIIEFNKKHGASNKS